MCRWLRFVIDRSLEFVQVFFLHAEGFEIPG
jgi:hypothetical protein